MRRTVTLTSDPVDARHFEISVRQLANSLAFGQEHSIFHGAGLEYAQSRPYVPGDMVKFIDWKVSARAGKLYVKEFDEPKQLPIYLLVDTSASMCFSSLPLSKYAWAVRIATGLALAAQREMRPVGLLGCGARELHIRPTLSRNIVLEWSHQLRRHDFLETTSLARRLRELLPSLKRRTLVVALTDLHDPEAIPALQTTAQQHECIAVHLQDPAEAQLRGAGLFRGVEAESGHSFVGHGRQRGVDLETLREQLTHYHVDYLHLRTDRPVLAPLRHFLSAR